MISFDRACELALKHYKDTLDIDGIYQPYDIGDAWVFNGGREGEEMIGIQKIAVAKNDGSISGFYLPSPENFALLDAAVAMELPEKFR